MNLKPRLSPIILLIFFCSCKQTEEAKIQEVCRQFINGRIALEKGDSTILKAVTDDSLFRLIMLNEQYASMVHAVKLGAQLRIMSPGAVSIRENCAVCEMNSYEHYAINLCKYGGSWKVKGENEIYASAYGIKTAEKKLADYKIRLITKPSTDSVLLAVNDFFLAAKAYFNKPDAGLLSESCNPATKIFVQQLYATLQKMPNVAVIKKEMARENFSVGDVLFQNNRVVFKFYQEETNVLLKKAEGNYIVTGFNGLPSENISPGGMRSDCISYLRALRLIRAKEYRDKSLNE